MSTTTPIHIRLAEPADIPQIRTLECCADEAFRSLNMDAIADCPAPALEFYATHQARGHLWVATLPHRSPSMSPLGRRIDRLIAFIQIDLFSNDGVFHSVYIHQISVSPEHARQGIGKALVEFVEAWARERGFRSVDLSTFDHVPWNRAYYERLGFKVLKKEELERGDARQLREEKEGEEGSRLLRVWKRVAMRKLM